MSNLFQALQRLIAAREGNFAVMAGLSAVPIIVALGGAVDMSQLNRAATIAQDTADAAALAAAKRLETGTPADAESDAQIYGRSLLPSDLAAVKLTNVIDTAKGTVVSTAKGTLTPSFLRLVGIDSLPFERSSTAAIRQKGYMDFQFLLDVSESMNIAASDADRIKLQATTNVASYRNRKCAFACHEAEPYWGPLSVYQMNQNAGSNKARLRIDVLRDAADAMIDQLLAKNTAANSLIDVRIQTNGFGPVFEKGEGPNKNATTLKASIRNFAVANSHTSFAAALLGLSGTMGTQGTGKSSSSPTKVALLITDGVKDEGFASSQLGPITPSLCDQIKSKGFDLAILEIKYVEDYDFQGYYKDRVAWYYPQISTNLQKCASKDLYYLASDALDAQTKLLSLTERLVTQKLRVAE